MNKLNEQIAKTAKDLLNVVIIKETKRPNGTIRQQQDFSNCPSLAEQHTAHLSDLNYLINKYKPDELAAYIAARSQHKREILGHDFTKEPDLQEAMNVVLRSKKEFEALPEEIRKNFQNHLEFIKFIDNPANAEKMVKMGLLTPDQIEIVRMNDKLAAEAAAKEASKKKSSKDKKSSEDKDDA